MSGTGFDDTVQFRAGVETNASEEVDVIRLGGITVSELAREGLKEMLQRTLSWEDTIQIYRRYEVGELEDEVGASGRHACPGFRRSRSTVRSRRLLHPS